MLGGLVSAVAGPIVGGLLGMQGARDQNQSSAKEAQKNRDFQERMSNTQHQRQVTDLRAAGLNPILSANSGAGTPSGSTAQVVNEMEPAISTAKQAAMIKNQLEQQKENIKLTKQQENTTYFQGMKNAVDANLGREMIKNARRTNDQIHAQTKFIQQNTYLQKLLEPGAENEAWMNEQLQDMAPGTRSGLTILKDLIGVGNSAKALSAIKKRK
jgi:hypothetical protein